MGFQWTTQWWAQVDFSPKMFFSFFSKKVQFFLKFSSSVNLTNLANFLDFFLPKCQDHKIVEKKP